MLINPWYGALTQPYSQGLLPTGQSLGGPLGNGEYQAPDTSLALLSYLLRTPQAPGMLGPSLGTVGGWMRPDPLSHPGTYSVPYPQEPPPPPMNAETPSVGINGVNYRSILRTGLLGQPVGTMAGNVGVPGTPAPGDSGGMLPQQGPQATLPQGGMLPMQGGMPPAQGMLAGAMPGADTATPSGPTAADGVTWDKVNNLLTNPALQGLMSGSLALMAKGGWSPRPINLAEGLGTAGQEGLNAAVTQQQNNRRYELLKEQAASLRAAREAQIEQTQASTQARARTNQLLAMLPQIQAMPEGQEKNQALVSLYQQLYPEDYAKNALQIAAERNKPITRSAEQEVVIPATGETFGKATPKLEPVQVGVPGHPEQTTTVFVDPHTGKPPGTAEGGAGFTPKTMQPLVSVNNVIPGSQAVQEQQAKDLTARQSQLRDIPYQMQETLSLMGRIKGNPFIGSFGAQKMQMAQFLNNNFGTAIAPEKIADAAEFNRQTMEQVAQQLRKIDSNPTERQQNQLREALGSLNTDPNALRRLMEVRLMYMRHALQSYNADVQSAKQSGTKFLYDPSIGGEPAMQPWERFNAP